MNSILAKNRRIIKFCGFFKISIEIILTLCYNEKWVVEMIKKDKRIDAKGRTRTQVRVVEGYWVGPGLPAKQRTIRDFGCLEDQIDPLAFMSEVEKFNSEYKKNNAPLRIEAVGTAKMYGEGNRRYNYGYKFLEVIYTTLSMT
jgi:hypothetical protein